VSQSPLVAAVAHRIVVTRSLKGAHVFVGVRHIAMVTWVRDVSVDKRARGVKFESLPPSPVLLLALSVGSGLALKVARVGAEHAV